jgi:hypothetical protein
MANGFHWMISEANQNIPIGQMVSRGGVKFEVNEKSWEKVETPFPIFEGMKIRTEKGGAVLALADRTRIEVESDSSFYFDQRDRLHLLRGKINFKLQPDVQLRFKVGNLWITKSYALQTAKGPSIALTNDKELVGSISMHSKGSMTVKSVQGLLSVSNEDGAVLASVSTGESITLPSVVVSSGSPIMMAKAETKGTEGPLEEEKGFLGLSGWTWFGIAAAVVIVGVIVGVSVWAAGSDDDDREAPVCP